MSVAACWILPVFCLDMGLPWPQAARGTNVAVTIFIQFSRLKSILTLKNGHTTGIIANFAGYGNFVDTYSRATECRT